MRAGLRQGRLEFLHARGAGRSVVGVRLSFPLKPDPWVGRTPDAIGNRCARGFVRQSYAKDKIRATSALRG
jgi:hypothetical protein